jgi:hypothetical protein
MKLSEAIRKGHTMTQDGMEFMTYALANRQCCCALGAAWYGIGKTERQYWDMRTGGLDALSVFSRELGIPRDLAKEISKKHCGGMTRLEIANWIEREYESKLPQKPRESDADYTRRVIQEITTGVSVGSERPRVEER